MERIREKGTVVLNRLADNPAESIAYSRFLNNESVSISELREESVARCNQVCEGRHVLCIQDTTEMNFQSHAGKLKDSDPDLGPVGNNSDIGFFLHPSVVVDSQREFPLGFGDIYLWNRSFDKLDKQERDYKSQSIEEKESYRWIESSQRCQNHLKAADLVTIVADRESDIYEEFVMVPDEKTHLLIRSKHDRCLSDKKEKLFSHLSSQPVVGSYSFSLKGDRRRNRKGREALMEVRFTKVKIKRPQNLANHSTLPEYVELYGIEVREHPSTIPAGEKGILWRLLTTHQVETLSEACQIIRWYCLRWFIEQLFRTIKSDGLDIQASQLESGDALKKLSIMALQVALQIMQLVQERDGKSGVEASVVFKEEEVECLEKINLQKEGRTPKQKNPYPKRSLAWAAWVIARLGGWKGYSSQYYPGPITMKRGLQAFEQILIGWDLAQMLLENHQDP